MSDQFTNANPVDTAQYLNPINKTLVVDEVIDRLVALIVNADLKPGDRLPTERELMARLGIGRSSLREAVKTLSAVGALEVKRGSGIFVGYGDASILAKPLAWGMFLSKSSVGQAIEARSVIEVALAGWAASRRSDEDLATLDQLIHEMEAVRGDRKAYTEYDLKFHMAIAEAAQNKILNQVLNIFQNLLRAWMEITYDETQGPVDSMESHRRLLQAIRDQDSKTARKIMQEHTSGAPLRSAVARDYSESRSDPDFLSMLKLDH